MDTSGTAHDRFGAAAERQAGRYGDKPFLTWYEDRRGERVELSFKTFDNWVAKTANLLVDELGAGPGDRVGALLVDHWQTPIVLAACWRAGAGVVALDPRDVPDPDGLAAAFVREELLAGAAALEGTPLVALTADLLGRAGHDLGRALNFSRVVPAMGDLFDAGPDPAGHALVAGEGSATMAELLDRAAGLAAGTGLTDFTTGAWVVLCRDLAPGRFWKRVADERVAVAVLDPDQAAAVLAAGPPPAGLDRSRLRVVASPGAGTALADGFPAAFGVPLLGS